MVAVTPPPRAGRSTDTPLAVPSAARAFAHLRRLLRLRCPNCGVGSVLTRVFHVRERCPHCGFRYERSDDNYFQGAMIVNFMLGAFTFAITLLTVLVVSWPNVPWNLLTFGVPLGLPVFMALLYPISKVVWLTVDVMVRPVMEEELV
jgi:uncharacterized protein (DUF983 family)